MFPMKPPENQENQLLRLFCFVPVSSIFGIFQIKHLEPLSKPNQTTNSNKNRITVLKLKMQYFTV